VVKEGVKNVLDVHSETLNAKYLGMPSNVGRSRGELSSTLKIEFGAKYKVGWSTLLSFGGKDVLIKSMAQALSIFSMACFKLPHGLCQHINSLLRKF
jgi:hypothetical protein